MRRGDTHTGPSSPPTPVVRMSRSDFFNSTTFAYIKPLNIWCCGPSLLSTKYLIADRSISSELSHRRAVRPALRSGIDIALPPKATVMDASLDEAMLPTDRAKPDIAIVGVVNVLQLVSRAQMMRSLESIDVVFNANSLGSKRPKCADRRFP